MSWERAFVAMLVTLGERPDDVLAMLPAASADVTDLAAALRGPSRTARAKALAAVLTAVALDVERTRLDVSSRSS